ncbi:MAG: hypothetical protein V2J19_06285 [Wenzhouxiangella sp.]|jgi:hypothetical protein|nr:hypothetical protein [Wenzhouxiangella sp.]
MSGNAVTNKERSEQAVDILFLPVSGSLGYGEIARCKIIARAVSARWPRLSMKLAISRHQAGPEESGLGIALLSGSPTFDVEGVAKLLDDCRPRLVIFDSGGRANLLRRARELGAATVFISSRPSSRRRAFSMRRMRNLDEAWLVGDPISQPRRLSMRERFVRKIAPATQHRFMGPIFPSPQAVPNPAADLVGDDYALFAPGGGATGGGEVVEVYRAAATRYVRATGRRAVVVCGPGADLSAGEHTVPVIGQLPPQEFANALAGCSLAVTGGGSLVGQALALDRPVVAVPLGGSDQRARVRELAAAGVLLEGGRNADELAAQAIRFHSEDGLGTACTEARRALQLEPGLPRILERIADILGLPS